MNSIAFRIQELECTINDILRELSKLKIASNTLEPANSYPHNYFNPKPIKEPVKELYVIFDLETNGLGKTDHIRVCQIGAIALDQNMCEISTFNKFVNPLIAIDPGATVVHGIDAEFVSTLNGWDTVGNSFNTWIEEHRGNGTVNLVAHNGKRFDARILAFEHSRHKLPIPSNMYLTDSIPVFKELFPNSNDYKLGTIYQNAFKEPIPDQHTALGDVKAMVRLLGTASHKLVRDKLYKHRESFDCVIKRCFKT